MSTQSSFQRGGPMNDMFSSLLSTDTSSLTPGYTGPLRSLSSDGHRQSTRPVSEILKPDNFKSAETQVLDKWFEDLQQYESSLESMATASLDPKYKEEVQHVDQWFRYLNEAERTATIYTLLQHSTQVQIRFFITVLQQMSKKDPLAALLSPAHPEKMDMQTQLAGAMAKAELDASQKLLSVLPYQTGQQVHRPNIGRRNQIDRHSFALGDNTEEYDRLFNNRNEFLSPRYDLNRLSMFEQPTTTRPKSVIESGGTGDLSSIFQQHWSYNTGGLVAGGHHQRQQQQNTIARPKSADISNWSSSSSSPSSAFTVRDNGTGGGPWSNNNLKEEVSWMNQPSVVLTEDTKGFRRRNIIPPPVVQEEEMKPNSMLFDQPKTTTTTTSKLNQFGQFLNPHRGLADENGYLSDHSDTSNRSTSSNKKKFGAFRQQKENNKNNSDVVDMQLLEDVPAWLRSLRLHKYNPIFESSKWQDMLKLDDEALLAKGVAALGARRKLLKVFDQVKAHCLANNITY